jgi:hypothetical protein
MKISSQDLDLGAETPKDDSQLFDSIGNQHASLTGNHAYWCVVLQ